MLFFLGALSVLLLGDIDSAQAQLQFDGQNTARKVCDFYNIVNGKITKAFATFAIIILGITSFFGKMNWGTALITVVAIGAAFGALSLATWLTGHQFHAGTCYTAPAGSDGGDTNDDSNTNNSGGFRPGGGSIVSECNGANTRPESCTLSPCLGEVAIVDVEPECETCFLLNGTRCVRRIGD